ncbi:MAG: hypothetical protein MGU50_15980 [Trichodesmium sp. MAG_R02]|nr:hypothetical protein [Trichodesmium sp. MAG_R02]
MSVDYSDLEFRLIRGSWKSTHGRIVAKANYYVTSLPPFAYFPFLEELGVRLLLRENVEKFLINSIIK